VFPYNELWRCSRRSKSLSRAGRTSSNGLNNESGIGENKWITIIQNAGHPKEENETA